MKQYDVELSNFINSLGVDVDVSLVKENANKIMQYITSVYVPTLINDVKSALSQMEYEAKDNEMIMAMGVDTIQNNFHTSVTKMLTALSDYSTKTMKAMWPLLNQQRTKAENDRLNQFLQSNKFCFGEICAHASMGLLPFATVVNPSGENKSILELFAKSNGIKSIPEMSAEDIRVAVDALGYDPFYSKCLSEYCKNISEGKFDDHYIDNFKICYEVIEKNDRIRLIDEQKQKLDINAEPEVAEIEKTIKELQKNLSSLGIFKFGQKNEYKQLIQEAEVQKAKVIKELKQKNERWLDEQKKPIQEEVDKLKQKIKW